MKVILRNNYSHQHEYSYELDTTLDGYRKGGCLKKHKKYAIFGIDLVSNWYLLFDENFELKSLPPIAFEIVDSKIDSEWKITEYIYEELEDKKDGEMLLFLGFKIFSHWEAYYDFEDYYDSNLIKRTNHLLEKYPKYLPDNNILGYYRSHILNIKNSINSHIKYPWKMYEDPFDKIDSIKTMINCGYNYYIKKSKDVDWIEEVMDLVIQLKDFYQFKLNTNNSEEKIICYVENDKILLSNIYINAYYKRVKESEYESKN